MEPIAALRRISFLLERALAPTHRVKAFRNAAITIAGLTPEDVQKRVTGKTLKTLPGIGPKTALVIEQAIHGLIPDYLADLEKDYAPLTTGGGHLLAALRGDLHSHSDWSDGGSPLQEMAITAMELGHEYLALTDHSPRLKVANGLSPDRLKRQLDIVAKVNERLAPFRLLTGIECDINEDGTLDQTDALLDRVDIVVASVHSKLRSDRATMTQRMLRAIENPHTDVLGHCTGRLITGGRGTRPPSHFDSAAVFAACAEHSVAVEINSRPERLDPPLELLREAVAAGCEFSIDTDAHAPGQLDFRAYGAERAEKCEIPAERIINTKTVDDLLIWTDIG